LIADIKDQIYFWFCLCLKKSDGCLVPPNPYVLYITYYQLNITNYDLYLTLYPLTQDNILGIPTGRGMSVVVLRTT